MTPRKRTDLKFWEIEDEGVVYDPTSGMGHVLNSTALRIWSLCDGSHSYLDIANQLQQEYPTHAASITQDVSKTIKQLGDLGLLEAFG